MPDTHPESSIPVVATCFLGGFLGGTGGTVIHWIMLLGWSRVVYLYFGLFSLVVRLVPRAFPSVTLHTGFTFSSTEWRTNLSLLPGKRYSPIVVVCPCNDATSRLFPFPSAVFLEPLDGALMLLEFGFEDEAE